MKNKKILVVIAIALTLVTALSLVSCAPSKITITFDTQGGSAISSMEVENSGSFAFPANPTKDGFVFSGWYMDTAYTIPYSSGKQKGDITLYAKWEPAPPVKTFTVTFDSQGGSAVAPITIEEYKKIDALPKPTREGHDFQHWSRDTDGTSVWSELDNVSQDMTLYAVWEKKLYHVTFDYYYNNQSGPTSTKYVKYDEKLPTIDVPQYPGLVFAGWYKEPACINVWDYEVDLVKGEMTLYAKWKEKEVATISFGVNSAYQPLKNFILNDTFSCQGLEIDIKYIDGETGVARFYGSGMDSALKMFQINDLNVNMQREGTYTINIRHRSSDKRLTYDVTVHDPAKIAPVHLFVKTPASKIQFAVGEEFTSDGLEIEKTASYDDWKDRRIPMTSAEYSIDSSKYDKTKAGTYAITIKGKKQGSEIPSCEYAVTVVDVSGQTIKELRVKNAPQQEFYVGESFNASGLIVEKVMSGGTVFVLLPEEYTIQKSAFDKTKVGEYSITIQLVVDNTKTTTYKTNVVAPKYIGSYYVEHLVYGHVRYMLPTAQIKEDGKYYDVLKDGSLDSVGIDIVIQGREKGKVRMSVDNRSVVFDPSSGVLDWNGNIMYMKKASQVSLKIQSSTQLIDKAMIVVDKGGCIPQDYINGIASIGSLFLTNDRTQPINSTTVFNENATIYVLHDIKNYNDLPFVGRYYGSDGINSYEFKKDGAFTSATLGTVVYTAGKNANGEWILTLPLTGETLKYDEKTEKLSMQVVVLSKVTSRHAVVTLAVKNNPDVERFAVRYVVEKGQAFNTTIEIYGEKYKLTLEGYVEGTVINADCAFVIVSAVLIQP